MSLAIIDLLFSKVMEGDREVLNDFVSKIMQNKKIISFSKYPIWLKQLLLKYELTYPLKSILFDKTFLDVASSESQEMIIKSLFNEGSPKLKNDIIEFFLKNRSVMKNPQYSSWIKIVKDLGPKEKVLDMMIFSFLHLENNDENKNDFLDIKLKEIIEYRPMSRETIDRLSNDRGYYKSRNFGLLMKTLYQKDSGIFNETFFHSGNKWILDLKKEDGEWLKTIFEGDDEENIIALLSNMKKLMVIDGLSDIISNVIKKNNNMINKSLLKQAVKDQKLWALIGEENIKKMIINLQDLWNESDIDLMAQLLERKEIQENIDIFKKLVLNFIEKGLKLPFLIYSVLGNETIWNKFSSSEKKEIMDRIVVKGLSADEFTMELVSGHLEKNKDDFDVKVYSGWLEYIENLQKGVNKNSAFPYNEVECLE